MADQNITQNLSSEEIEERRNAYILYWQEANKQTGSTSDLLDKYLLTLSSGFLAGSLTIVSLVTKNNHPDLTLLCLACISLIATIIFTLISFPVSIAAQNKASKLAEKYYLDHIDSAIHEENCAQKAVGVLRYFTLVSFVLGVMLLTIFTFTNL
jgi:hypothetical protein